MLSTKTMLPILYTFRRCPYAIRARMALVGAGVKFEVREVILKQKPRELLEVSPKETVPVLVTEKETFIESLDIMLWAVQQNDTLGWSKLSANDQKEMLVLIEVNDSKFKYHLDRYKYPQKYNSNPIEHRSEAGVFLQKLESKLNDFPFLFGEFASLADIAIFPFVRQFSKVDFDWFQNSSYKNLQCWLQKYTESVLFQKIMKKYKAWHFSDPVIYFD